ncbi:MAG: STAS/SEC14 domain-containing protein [Planctomycetota bacterium]
MPVELKEEADGQVLAVTVSGSLKKQDYDELVPEVERLIDERGTLRILFRMRDFHGWTAGALWEDIKFDLKHFNDIERLAFVGEKAWQKGMSVFCKPFTTAKIRYFEPHEADQARAWLREDRESDGEKDQ